jgi:hypothetical protein
MGGRMFTAELKINGLLVGHLYGVNKGPVVSEQVNDLCHYEYHYYDTESGTVVHGNLVYRQSNGLPALVSECLTDAKDKRNDDKS